MLQELLINILKEDQLDYVMERKQYILFQEVVNILKDQQQKIEMGERYLKAIFTFFGISDFNTISAEKEFVLSLLLFILDLFFMLVQFR